MTELKDEHKYVIDMNKHLERSRVKERLKIAEKKLDALRDACQTNTKVDWDWAELSPNEEFKRLVEMIDE
jgi:hypothetical protein